MEYTYLNRIDSPADLKQLKIEELPAVCAELRQFIIEVLSKNPGHLASSLGTIELTVALHYVFDTPNDKLVWDVGHQAYAHKILTGRRDRFHTNRQFKGLSPFTNPAESEYDAFIAGHASNSISAALGLDVAGNSNVVAIIGDGAMTGGLAFEGLNNTSMDKNNLLIVLNDNHMAIDPLKGGITQYLVDLTTSGVYNKWRWKLYQLAAKLHLVDERKRRAMLRRNNSLKAVLSKQQSNIFTGLNIRYFGPTDGHDVESLVRILSEIKNHRGPKVLHIITKKGKGYAPAENDQTVWHAPGEFDVATGLRQSDKLSATQSLNASQPMAANDVIPPLWQEVFGETLLELAKKNDKIVGITPAMPSGCSMSIMQKEMPDRVFDVGIAEGHAVTFSAGLAKAGMVPYCNIYSTFLQRAYDNIVHDVALQNLHVVICIDRAGIVGNDGATHHGLLDLAYLRPIPNMQICAPRTAEDLRQMLKMAETLDGPVAIRYPRGRTPIVNEANDANGANDGMVKYGKGVKLRDGKNVAVLTIGAIGNTMAEAIEELKIKNEKLKIAHYDMRWLKPLDEDILHEVGKKFKTIVTAEDGMIAGGLGSAVLEWMADHGYTPRVIRLGVRDQFVEHGSTKELYHMLKLDKEGLCESLLQVPEK